MEVSVPTLLGYWWVLPLLFAILLWKWATRLLGIVIVRDDSIGPRRAEIVASERALT